MQEILQLLQSGGWMAIALLAAYLIYKTTMVGIITLAIYKAVKLLVQAFSSRSLEARIAAEMGVKTPLTPGEEAYVLKAVRKKEK